MSVIAGALEGVLQKVKRALCKVCDPTWEEQNGQNDDDEDEEEIVDHTEANLTSDFTKLAFESSGDSLRLCAYYLVLYILVAIFAFSFLFEKWTIIDSIYFAVTCFTTIGYGDLTASTTGGHIFTCFFAMFGIIILGIFLGIIGHALAKVQEDQVAEIEKKTQEQVLGLVSDEHHQRSMEHKRQEQEVRRRGSILSISGHGEHKQSSKTKRPEEASILEAEERKEGEETGKAEEEDEETTVVDDIYGVVKAIGPIMLLLVTIVIILGYFQGWSVATSIYFCVVSFSTIGFGDITPKTQIMRLVFAMFLPIGVASFGEMLSRIAAVYIEHKNRTARSKFLQRSITLCDLNAMDDDNNGDVSREEFVCFMLVALQKVTQDDIVELQKVFARLDVDNSGAINKHDLVVMARARKAEDKELIGLQEQGPKEIEESYRDLRHLSTTEFDEPEGELHHPTLLRHDYESISDIPTGEGNGVLT